MRRASSLAIPVAALIATGAVVLLHFLSWGVLALRTGSDSGPTRYCPCPFHATIWTFIFWLPEFFIVVGLVAAILARAWIYWPSLLSALAAVLVVDFLYGADLRRVWSLP